jgi:hypothetical protein
MSDDPRAKLEDILRSYVPFSRRMRCRRCHHIARKHGAPTHPAGSHCEAVKADGTPCFCAGFDPISMHIVPEEAKR